MKQIAYSRRLMMVLTTAVAALTLLGLAATKPPAEKNAPAKAAKKAAAKAQPAALPSPIAAQWQLADGALHRDFPALCLDSAKTPWIAYIEHDGTADVLRLARQDKTGLDVITQISEPGVIHQPAIACDGSGALWCFWGQVDSRNVVSLRARRFLNGKLDAPLTLAESAGSDTFADAGADHAGRVWVVWQSLRRGQGDIFTRYFDPKAGQWSPEIMVNQPEGGNWEPRVAFDGRDGAWIVFDSSRGGEFNLYLAQVAPDGIVKEQRLTESPEYEARATIATTGDGKGFWIAAERGRQQWGRDQRGHDGNNGLNGQKRILLGRYEIQSGKFTEVTLPAEGKPAPKTALEVNLPVVAVDGAGNPWIAYRFFLRNRWSIALTKYDLKTSVWQQPLEVPGSDFGQDRHCALLSGAKGQMLLCWPSDRRENKMAGVAGVFLAQLDPPFVPHSELATRRVLTAPEPYFNASTPERPLSERHTWNFGGKQYGLYFGDLHRHTDFSNCRTGQDGCVVEQFRYAVDIAGLDFLGTSDHTDVGKRYDPYEWWQTQRLVDVFYAPGRFTSLYAYEREQRQPWGHRNIIFAERGGPIIYINRQLYRNSQWQERFPVRPGADDISPMELWELLRQYGKPVAVISHTGATGMGTDWEKYERIDNTVENLVEIFQGARVSYEGIGAPQPTVGLRQNEPYTPSAKAGPDFVKPPAPIEDFGEQFKRGVYQYALERGHKLGVFASSDHISTHASFGGVYTEDFTREGIIAAFNARRTIAATDKIFVEFSCNGQPLGSVFETKGKPALEFAIYGTAPVKRVTIVRNERDYKIFEPASRDFKMSFTDESPLEEENRYYLRVEQTDGNMAWSSPVWVTMVK